MTRTSDRHLSLTACAASLTLHGVVVTLAVLLVSQIKPLPVQDTFQWNVALVETPREQSVEPAVQPMPSIPPNPVPTREVTQTLQLNRAVQREPPPSSEVTKAIASSPANAIPQPLVEESRQEAPHVVPPVRAVAPVHAPQQAERVPSAILQSEAPVEMPGRPVQESTVMRAEAPAGAQEELANEARADSQPVQTNGAFREPATSPGLKEPMQSMPEVPVPASMAAVPGAPMAPQMAPHAPTEPVQPVSKAVPPAPAARADYGWLIDSLGRRLAQLKRYPATARLNGWEGKVVLRAVIRADGNLADVKVKKSSGYDELDAAAMDVLRQACPLSMQQALGRPDIVVNIPVIYALAQ